MNCKIIEKCHVATAHDYEGIKISVGVYFLDGIAKFVIVCIQGRTRCQHIHTGENEALVVIERLSRALRLASELGGEPGQTP